MRHAHGFLKSAFLIAFFIGLTGCQSNQLRSGKDIPTSRKGDVFYVSGESKAVSNSLIEEINNQQISELNDRIVLLKMTEPRYPRNLYNARVSGHATLQFFVGESGKVVRVYELHSTHEDFALAAAIALRDWEFEPPTVDGQPAEVSLRQMFFFNFDQGIK